MIVPQGENYEKRYELMQQMEDRVRENKRNGHVVIAAGIADYEPARDSSVVDVFQRADSRMYDNKSALKH